MPLIRYVAVTTLIAASMQAEEVNLVCTSGYPSTRLTFDEKKEVASFDQDTDNTANFTENAISWSGYYRDYGISDFYLDRVTGKLTVTYNIRGGRDHHAYWDCAPAKKKF